jgi:hypothetical protein
MVTVTLAVYGPGTGPAGCPPEPGSPPGPQAVRVTPARCTTPASRLSRHGHHPHRAAVHEPGAAGQDPCRPAGGAIRQRGPGPYTGQVLGEVPEVTVRFGFRGPRQSCSRGVRVLRGHFSGVLMLLRHLGPDRYRKFWRGSSGCPGAGGRASCSAGCTVSLGCGPCLPAHHRADGNWYFYNFPRPSSTWCPTWWTASPCRPGSPRPTSDALGPQNAPARQRRGGGRTRFARPIGHDISGSCRAGP